jgi:hypothetical protein
MLACPAEEGGGRSLGIVDKPGGEPEPRITVRSYCTEARDHYLNFPAIGLRGGRL